jgi:hypothetical protein
VFAGQLPKEGDTADDQFTFGKKSYSFYKRFERILVELVKTL